MANYHATYGNNTSSNHNTTTQREAINQATRNATQNNTTVTQVSRTNGGR